MGRYRWCVCTFLLIKFKDGKSESTGMVSEAFNANFTRPAVMRTGHMEWQGLSEAVFDGNARLLDAGYE